MADREFRHGLDDILSAIEGIRTAIAGKSYDDYATDWVLKHAVERGIEIISEASRLLPANIQALRPEVPWARVRGIGNILRHDYWGVSNPIIWRVAIDELPRLHDAVVAILAQVDR